MYIILALLFPTLAFSFDTKTQPMELPLTKVSNDGKSITLTVGLGSGAFHPKDQADIVYFISDRGPNVPKDLAKDLLGVKFKDKKGYVFLQPTYAPSIYKVKLKEDGYEILETIEIKDEKGQKITGLPNPNNEVGLDINAKPLAFDPQGLDTESIVKLKDGTFYVSDEYLPSLVHIAADGKIMQRLIPGKELPAILSKIKPNRGIEAMALSPDEKYLYYAVQSPLRHPNDEVLQTSRLTRVCRLNLMTLQTDQQYVYALDEAKTFRDDSVVNQEKVVLSEMAMIDADQILVLERVEKTTKLYVTKINSKSYNLAAKWSDELTKPALEELNEDALKKQKIKLLPKRLVLDSVEANPKFPIKIEGMTHLGKDEWLLINDNDFGITGEKTQLIRIKLLTQK